MKTTIFSGLREPANTASRRLQELPPAPPWRASLSLPLAEQATAYVVSDDEIAFVNAAMILRRPLLITGKPGTGKSSLAYAIAADLGLGPVLKWSITSRSVLKDGLYSYDAIARFEELQRKTHGALDGETTKKGQQTKPKTTETPETKEEQETEEASLCRYIRLGPLGTAFATSTRLDGVARPRVLLIDELDKSDVDLPNDLLHLFEDGMFEIAEISRLVAQSKYKGKKLPFVRTADLEAEGSGSNGSNATYQVDPGAGIIRCTEFPIVIMTSNQERDFSPAFHRRCLRLTIEPPGEETLKEIVRARFKQNKWPQETRKAMEKFLTDGKELSKLVEAFLIKQGTDVLATDQLLHAVHLRVMGIDFDKVTSNLVWKSLDK